MRHNPKPEKDRQNTGNPSNVWADSKNNDTRPCIWMQAGISPGKTCNNFYDCTTCKYDAAMGKRAVAGKHLSWQDAMRLRSSSRRTCRHSVTGRADHRVCPMNYNCKRCDFDQYVEETLCAETGHAGPMKDIKGFKMPVGYRFHKGHTWAVIGNGGIIRIGMDDFAFKLMGGPDGFDLPLTGQELNRDIPAWGIKRNTNTADVRSPVNGVITKVNSKAAGSPEMTSHDPYGDGWLFIVHNPDIKKEFKALMGRDESENWLNREVDTLERMIEAVTGPMSTDGGLLQRDVHGNLPGLGWNNLTRTFLGT